MTTGYAIPHTIYMTTVPFPHIFTRTMRDYDIRPIDFQTGKRVAIATEDMKECDCCGRRIVRCFDLDNGMTVGSECEGFLSVPVMRMGRTNKKAVAILAAMA